MSTFDCTITVYGNGVGLYGHSKKDRVGPVHRFMTDNTIIYSRVGHHIFGGPKTKVSPEETPCLKCSPEEALRIYLNRRTQRGDGVSSGLIKVALSWEKRAQKQGRPISKPLLDEMILRAETITVIENSHRFSTMQLFMRLRGEKIFSTLLVPPRVAAIYKVATRLPKSAPFNDIDAALYQALGSSYADDDKAHEKSDPVFFSAVAPCDYETKPDFPTEVEDQV